METKFKKNNQSSGTQFNPQPKCLPVSVVAKAVLMWPSMPHREAITFFLFFLCKKIYTCLSQTFWKVKKKSPEKGKPTQPQGLHKPNFGFIDMISFGLCWVHLYVTVLQLCKQFKTEFLKQGLTSELT